MARAGTYRDRAAFQRKVPSGKDALGNDVSDWQPLLSVWGNLREAPGREVIAAGRLEAPVPGTLRVRASAAVAGITAADRVVVRGFTWDINSPPVDVDGRGREFELTILRGGAVQ